MGTRPFFQQVQIGLERLPPKTPHFHLARMIEVVNPVGIGGVPVLLASNQPVPCPLEALVPGVGTRVEQAPARLGVDVGLGASVQIAEAAGVKTIGVLVDELWLQHEGYEVLDTGEASGLHPVKSEVTFMAQTEGAGETELPAQARSKLLIAKTAAPSRRVMAALDLRLPWVGDGR